VDDSDSRAYATWRFDVETGGTNPSALSLNGILCGPVITVSDGYVTFKSCCRSSQIGLDVELGQGENWPPHRETASQGEASITHETPSSRTE